MSGVGPPSRTVEVLEPGLLTTVQDLGRPGRARLGVSPSGAADLPAARLANRLVGNTEDAAVLEATLGGLVLRFPAGAVVAVTGADAGATVREPEGRPRHLAGGSSTYVGVGGELRLGVPARGLRTCVAVRGGLDVPRVLGSRSTDLLGGIGPAPLAAGDVLPLGEEVVGEAPALDVPAHQQAREPGVLRLLAGPRLDRLGPRGLDALCCNEWSVSVDSDRVAVRLTGQPLPVTGGGEVPSEALLRGSVQLPPGGRPVVFLADHPVTGGYPVVAVVITADLPALAQLRPGEEVHLRRAPGANTA